MKILIVVLLIISSNLAIADGLYTGAWSYHYYKDDAEAAGYKINSNQNLLAYEHNGYMIGYFKNSFNHDSIMASKYFEIYKYTDVQFGAYVGLNYGYRWCGSNYSKNDKAVVCPHAIPEIRYTKYNLQPSILIFQYGAAITFRWELE